MDEEGSRRSPREPSAALDRLFLELHDHLPRDTRERFAKLANEVKKLTETSTAGALETQPPSADHGILRREEGIGTVEAKQSSVGLIERGAVVTSLSDEPTLKDIVCFAVPRVAPKWYDIGLALDVKSFVLDTIIQEQKCPDQPRSMLVKWLQESPGTGSQARTWQSVLDAVGTICGTEAVEDIQTAVQTPRIPTAVIQRKRHRSSTQSSEEHDLEQPPIVKKQLHKYIDLKIDLLAKDMSDIRSESDPSETIRLLYGNSLSVITKLLAPHLAEVKVEADKHCQLGLHHEVVAQDVIQSAQSVDSLFNHMSVTKMWDKTRFLRKAVGAVPVAAPERRIAEAILSHYNMHLDIYKQATLLKDSLAKRKKSVSEKKRKARRKDIDVVALKITAKKTFDKFTDEDCYRLQARVLSTAYGIPEEKIICHNADDSHSTTVTFLIPAQYIHDIVQRSTQLPTVWTLLEIGIIEVSIPGVFTFNPSGGSFLTLLRGRKVFTADLLRVTEVLPYQTYSLLDLDTKEPLSGQPLNTKRIEQHWDSNDDLGNDPPSSVPESEDVEIVTMHPDEAVTPLEGTDVSATDELQSKVSELEAKMKDLERKVADLCMDNVALKTKLEASRKVEKQQQEEITTLKERLVQALRAQETATQEQSLSKTRESQLVDKIKLLEEAKFDLEAEIEQLEKQMKQLEILSSDTEQLTKPTAHQEPSADELEAVAGESATNKEGAGKDPTGDTSTTQGPSADQQEAVRGGADKIREEARKSSTGETTARDSAIKKANDLQKQFSDLYKDHEKLRKVKVSELHGKMDLIEDLMESEQQNEADLDSADMDYQALKVRLEATAEDASKAKTSLDRVSSELEVKIRQLECSEKQLKDTRQWLKEKVEECNVFENAQLHWLPHSKDLQKERQQLDVQVVQMRAELAKLEAERNALLGQLRDFAVTKAENESLRSAVKSQAGMVRHWNEKAKTLTELEKDLTKKQIELTVQMKMFAELKRKFHREFVSKEILESTVKQSVRESFTESKEELLNASGMEMSGSGVSEGSPDSVFVRGPMGRRDMSEILRIQHQLDIAKQEIEQQKTHMQDAEKKVQECSEKIHMLAESYFESHRYPPFLYQLHQKGLPSSGVESTSTMCDGGAVEVSDITDMRLYQPDASWCDEFQFLMNKLKTMPSKEHQAYAFISFLHCGRVITFYRFHVVLVPQVLSCEQDLHPIELEGGAKPKAMLVYAHTQLRSSNLKEFGIKVHPKGVLLQPEFEGDIPELEVSLDELEDVPAGLEDTERCLDARILHQLQCQYKRFATPVRTAPSGVAMAVI